MATPNEYQKKWIEEKGLSLESLAALPQDDFDSIVPSAPKAEEPKKAAPLPAPALKPSAVKKKPEEEVVFQPIDPEKDITQALRIPRETRLPEAQESFISSRSKTPEGFRGTTEEIEAEEKRAAALKGVPFTPGGEPRQPIDIPFTDIPIVTSPEKTKELARREYTPEDGWRYDVENKVIEFNQMLVGARPKTGWLGLLASLSPTVIATSEEAKAADQARFDASLMAAHQYSNYYDYLADQAKESGDTESEKKLRDRARMYRSEIDMDPITKSQFLARRNSLLAGETPMDPYYDIYAEGPPAPVVETAKEAVSTAGMALAEEAFMKRGPGGTLMESPAAHLGRVLSAPVSAGVGAVEAISSEKELAQTVPARVEEGLGVMGAGIDIGEAAADALELEADHPGRKALTYTGGGIGLVADFMLPIVPGAGFVTGGAKGLAGGAKVAKALDLPLSARAGFALESAVTGAKTGFLLEDLPIAGWAMAKSGSPIAPLDPRTVGLIKFANDSNNQQLAELAFRMIDDIEPSELVGKTEQQLKEIYGAAYKRAAGDMGIEGPLSYERFLEAAKRKGLNIEDPAWQKNLRKNTNQYYTRAAMDMTVPAESKAAMLLEGSASSKKLVGEIAYFLSRKNLSQAELTSLWNSLPPKLRAELKKTPYGFDFIEGEAAIGALPAEARRAVSKQILLHSGDSLLESGLDLPGLGRYRRVSPTSFIPESQYGELQKLIDKSVIGVIKEGLENGSIPIEDGIIKLPSDYRRGLIELVQRARGRGGLGSIQAQQLIVPEIKDIVGKLTPKRWNQLVELSIDSMASSLPGYKSILDVQSLVKGRGAIAAEEVVSKILTPKEVAGGTLETTLKGFAKDATGMKPTDPLADEFVSEVSQKWGAMYEDFQRIYKANRAEGLSPQEAWAKTMIQNYIRHITESVDPISFRGKIILDSEGLDMLYRQMFSDYVAQAYGGHESIRTVLDTSRGSKIIREIPVSVEEMQQVGYLVSHSDEFLDNMDEFVAAINEGRWTDALEELYKAHKKMESGTPREFIPDDAALDKAIRSVEDSFGGVALKPILKEKVAGPPIEGQRGLTDILNATADSKPVYSTEDFLELMSAQYLTRRQSAILQEALTNARSRFPDLFPSVKDLAAEGSAFSRKMKVMAVFEADTIIGKDWTAKTPLEGVGDPQRAAFERGVLELIAADQKFATRLYSELLMDVIYEQHSGAPSKSLEKLMREWEIPERESISLAALHHTDSDKGVMEIKRAIRKVAVQFVTDPDAKALLRGMSGADIYADIPNPSLAYTPAANFERKLAQALSSTLESNAIFQTRKALADIKAARSAVDTIAMEKGLAEAADIKGFTETMDKMLKGKYDPRLNRLYKRLVEIWDGLSSWAKGALLGGQFFPNLRFLTTNHLTGPAIIHSTLGAKYSVPSLKALFFSDFKVNSIMKHIDETQWVTGPKGELLHKAGVPTTKPILVTPGGKVYTDKMLAEIITQSSIARSQASAELTTNMIKEIVSWSATNAKKLRDTGKISNAEYGAVRRILSQEFGGPIAGRQMNIWSNFANNTDIRYRASVLVKALEAGEDEATAIRLAREALFDYGNLSNVEKNVINRVFWFWTFRRNNLLNFAKNMTTNPDRIKNIVLATKYLDEADGETTIATKDYAEMRPMLWLVNDPEMKQRYSVNGPSIPTIEAMSELIDYMSYFMIFGNEGLTGTEKMRDFTRGFGTGFLDRSNPAFKAAMALGYGVTPYGSGVDRQLYLDPRMIWYLQQDPQKWDTFTSYINVEVVPYEDERPGGGTYQGRQYRIKKGDEASAQAWYAMQQLMLFGGVQRTLRDYAPMFSEIFQDIEERGDVRPPQLQHGFWQTVGVVTPIEQPTLEERVEMNRRALYYEFKDRSVTETK